MPRDSYSSTRSILSQLKSHRNWVFHWNHVYLVRGMFPIQLHGPHPSSKQINSSQLSMLFTTKWENIPFPSETVAAPYSYNQNKYGHFQLYIHVVNYILNLYSQELSVQNDTSGSRTEGKNEKKQESSFVKASNAEVIAGTLACVRIRLHGASLIHDRKLFHGVKSPISTIWKFENE